MSSKKFLVSDVKNLTLSVIPNDRLNIVLSEPKTYQLSTRLVEILRRYRPFISQIPAPESCPNAVTAIVPRALVERMLNLLRDNVGSCLDDTVNFMNMLSALLTSTTKTEINVTRLFFKRFGQCIRELYQYEIRINIASAAIRSVVMPVSTDAQSTASIGLLNKALLIPRPNTSNLIKSIPPLFKQSQETLKATFNRVKDQNPQTIGAKGPKAPTNMISMEALDAATGINYSLSDSSNPVCQSYHALMNLFSSAFLNTPIKEMYEIAHLFKDDGKTNTLVINSNAQYSRLVSKPVSVLTGTIESLDSEGRKVISPKSEQIEALVREYYLPKADTTAIDKNRSILDQDWLVVATSSPPANEKPGRSSGKPQFVDTITLAQDTAVPTTQTFIGISTGREYTYDQMRGLATNLKTLWTNVVNVCFYSLQNNLIGVSLIDAGLGVIGEIAEVAGYVNSSFVSKILDNGPGTIDLNDTYVKLANPGLSDTDYNKFKQDLIKPALCRYMLSIIPNVVRAGYEAFKQHGLREDALRSKLSSYSWDILNAYAPNVTEQIPDIV